MAVGFRCRKLAAVTTGIFVFLMGSANADSGGSFQLKNAYFRLAAASVFCDAITPLHSQSEAALRTGVFEQWKLQWSNDFLENGGSVDQINTLLRYMDGVFRGGAEKYNATVCAAYVYTELGEDYWTTDIGRTVDLSQNPQWSEDIRNNEKLNSAKEVEIKVCEVASSFWDWSCPDITY